MTYTKNHDPWVSGDLIEPATMDNFETIYTEASSYLAAHNHDATYYTQTEMRSTFWYSGNDGSGSGADADLIYKSTGNLHAASFSGLGVPTGLVILWYGSTGSIPGGWQLCNGTGTVDLRGRFPIGSGTGATYSPGSSGGSATFSAAGTITVANHTLSVAEIASHRHPFVDRYIPTYLTTYGYSGSSGLSAVTVNGTTPAAGGGQGHSHSASDGTSFSGNAVACLPFYYALCYIQKI